ncbi:DUF1613-domain-containing protein [Dissoconium aciculare CBS 342.82]|uniref:tRNA (uracil-O(2)-)-methyltransferase n=1 Tax=Dissoconium aciculare CBS 342.82 TaxID=1314786 RepID=A0A6J3MIE7_9PEZI|nr:DUF1613-domain-containing protein [Dissoconium aciculare CBS 342.82]KAF1827696.1 DUF1613-domain-containing protein [Dissoconium aciculare CBS 342.82]
MHKFEPFEVPNDGYPGVVFPDDLWHCSLQCRCTFTSDVFTTVMLNLIKNPNITSSHLFRADILYDSDSESVPSGDPALHQVEYQPIDAQWQGFEKTRTIVRRLIPRNPQLDKSLVQTCHFFRNQELDLNDRDHGAKESLLILYVPHVQSAEEMPFYHPAVSQLAFLFEHATLPSLNQPQSGTITILYRLFPNSILDNKLSRTALRLLQIIYKHGQGILAGYEKRVHLDQLIPQKKYQDTYTRLKMKYGKQLAEQWVEVTDPGKHVFEDIAIAAYLIELWSDMYSTPGQLGSAEGGSTSKPVFPGFVDIGCGNGILVHILLSEGYAGCGFDARERKTWTIFPKSTREKLERRILVPDVFQKTNHQEGDESWHTGMFHNGEFIISNHADELTPWTPLLAFLSGSAFVAIPCCSHDLSGARFRAPKGKKMPSAYATLCSYVASLAEAVDFIPEQDVLRIPSTRNQCIIGRKSRKRTRVIQLVERETKSSIALVAKDWVDRAQKLMLKPASGH